GSFRMLVQRVAQGEEGFDHRTHWGLAFIGECGMRSSELRPGFEEDTSLRRFGWIPEYSRRRDGGFITRNAEFGFRNAEMGKDRGRVRVFSRGGLPRARRCRTRVQNA